MCVCVSVYVCICMYIYIYIYIYVYVYVGGVSVCVRVCVRVLAVYNRAQAQRISNREFKLWTFLQGTESRVATFLAETSVMSHQSLNRQAKTKRESPTAVEFESRTPKSDHGSCENVYSAQPLCWSGCESTPPPLTRAQYGKMESKYPEGGHSQSVLRPHGVFNVPLYI